MTSSPRCHIHPDHPAVAICYDCRCDICADCHGVDPSGIARGLKCCADEDTQAAQAFVAWENATLRQLPGAFVQTAAFLLTTIYAEIRVREGTVEVLPKIPYTGKPLRAALFGMICLFVGTTAATLWRWTFVGDRFGHISRLSDLLEMNHTTAMVVSLIAQQTMLPVFFLIHVTVLWMGLRLVGVEEPTSEGLPKAFHIAGYAAAAHLFQFVPPIVLDSNIFPIDHFLVFLWLWNLELTACRAHFGLRYLSAFSATLGPVMVSFVLFVAR